jgi:hypothetical protein
VAVREFVLKSPHGRADYLLSVDGAAVGVLEAKKEGETLTGVAWQTAKPAPAVSRGVMAKLSENSACIRPADARGLRRMVDMRCIDPLIADDALRAKEQSRFGPIA